MSKSTERYIKLYGGCYCTQLKVTPQNWDQAGASIKKDWVIWYRFYDPAITDANGKAKPKLVLREGMNKYRTLSERREATKVLILDELELLQKEGYNPVTEIFMIEPEEETDAEISPTTEFLKALSLSLDKLTCVPHTKEDIQSVINFVEPAAVELRMDKIPVKDVRRRHIKKLLNHLSKAKKNWSNNQFNTYRKYLHILFEELIENEATEVNPVHGIKKKKHAVKKREVLTPEQCEIVDEFARNYDTRFWMLINIFHLSGARTTEIVKVQGQHVNLQKQSVKYLIMKGDQFEWIERPIVDEALPFWQMAMKGCGKEDFVFSVGLKPGQRAIRPEQLSRRWKRHIKDKLEIDCDWYALKHLNTTKNVDKVIEMIREAQLQAGKLNAHKSGKMVAQVYDIKSAQRMDEELKQKSIGLASAK